MSMKVHRIFKYCLGLPILVDLKVYETFVNSCKSLFGIKIVLVVLIAKLSVSHKYIIWSR